MLSGGNFGMQLQPHVTELQRIFYTVNPVQVSGGGEQNVWGASGKFGGGGNCPPCPDLEPPLTVFLLKSLPAPQKQLLRNT